jgi:hypothetical protein
VNPLCRRPAIPNRMTDRADLKKSMKPEPLKRVIGEYVETWSGAHTVPGFCICRVIEEEGKPIRVQRSKAIYLKDAPEMGDWIAVFDRANSNLRSRAWYEEHGKKRNAK